MPPVLAVSLAALVAGPFVALALDGRAVARAALSGFVVASVVGLVLIHVLPRSLELAGWWAAPGGLVGLVVPVLMHRGLHQHADGHAEHGTEVSAALVFALNGLAIHSFLDGASLTGFSADRPEAAALVTAVVLHQLPAGTAIWWVCRPRLGVAAAVGVLLFAALATWAGAALAPGALVGASAEVLGGFQALAAGALLHVALEHGPSERTASIARGRLLGAAVAAASLLGTSLTEAVADGVGWRVVAEGAAAVGIAAWVARRR